MRPFGVNLILKPCGLGSKRTISYHLGLDAIYGIKVDRDSTGIHLTQSKYIVDVLHWSKMAGAKPSSTPIASGSKLTASYGDPLDDLLCCQSTLPIYALTND